MGGDEVPGLTLKAVTISLPLSTAMQQLPLGTWMRLAWQSFQQPSLHAPLRPRQTGPDEQLGQGVLTSNMLCVRCVDLHTLYEVVTSVTTQRTLPQHPPVESQLFSG